MSAEKEALVDNGACPSKQLEIEIDGVVDAIQ